MTSSRTPRLEPFQNPVARKIIVTLVAGSFTYGTTNLTDQPQSTVLTLTVLIGGVTLLAQFLSGFESQSRRAEERLALLERRQADGFRDVHHVMVGEISRINQATRLYEEINRLSFPALSAERLTAAATSLAGMTSSLAGKVAQAEIDSAFGLAERLARGEEVFYEGEDRDWLFALTSNASTSIAATSRASKTVDGGFADEGFWSSEIGVSYLAWQRRAVERGVSIRRIFVVEDLSTIAGSEFREVLREQVDAGIEARILDASTIPPARRLLIPDIVIFDREISYELATGSRFGSDAMPFFISTRLISHKDAVDKRVRSFEELWTLSSNPRANPAV